MKKIAIVWGIIIICIFGLLTFYGLKFKEIKNYKFLEMNMKTYAKKYVKEMENFKYTKSFKITLDEIKNKYAEENFVIKKEECTGYVKVSKNIFGLKYIPYIECNNYKTK